MTSPGLRPLAILFVALALSIGWGVRGNWGHEYGAMIPGALAAMAAVLVSAREDWHRRVAYFAFFGALGWSFGGQISYMIVISYTHSGHYPSTLYGFAGLFVIGFLWGAMGGAGTTLPAVASRERLTALFPPILWVFAAWCIEDLLFYWADHAMQPAPGDASWRAWLLTRLDYDRALDWYDTDWFSAVFALLAVALPAAIGRGAWRSWQFWGSILAGALVGHIIVAYLGWQLPRPYRPACWESFNWGALVGGTLAGVGYLQWTRRFSAAAELVVFMGAGWLAGLILLVEVLGLRMTPPRGDSWAGALGMTVGMFAWLARHNLPLVAWGGIIGGLASGLGFAGAALIKLCAMTTGWQTNWHSVLEQTYGFISGVGIALLLGYLSTRAPRVADDPPVRRWTEPVAIFFTLLAITYLNIRKNLWTVWLKNSDNPGVPPFLPDEMLGISTMTWFHLGYAALAAAVVVPVLRHYLGRRVALFETSWLARGQLLFLVLLWWIVVGNLTRLVPFHPQRMVTEGVIHFNACLCTLLALVLPRRGESLARWALPNVEGLKVRSWFAVFASALVFSVVASLAVRAIYLDRHAGQSNLHIRFGPNNTNAKVWTEQEKNCHGRRP